MSICESRISHMFKKQLETEHAHQAKYAPGESIIYMDRNGNQFSGKIISYNNRTDQYSITSKGKTVSVGADMLWKDNYKENTSRVFPQGTPVWYTNQDGADIEAKVVSFDQTHGDYLIDTGKHGEIRVSAKEIELAQ